MRNTIKAAMAALVMAGGALAASPASAQQFGLSIGPRGGISFSVDTGGYCDHWGCPDAFWGMPVFYGPVFFAGSWYDGPLYYRDWHGHREYWIHGGWHGDEWRGPHPSWWRPGHVGPALGMDFYRSHGFHGRWDAERHDVRLDRGRGALDRRDNFTPDHHPQPQDRHDDRGNEHDNGHGKGHDDDHGKGHDDRHDH